MRISGLLKFVVFLASFHGACFSIVMNLTIPFCICHAMTFVTEWFYRYFRRYCNIPSRCSIDEVLLHLFCLFVYLKAHHFQNLSVYLYCDAPLGSSTIHNHPGSLNGCVSICLHLLVSHAGHHWTE